MLKLNEGKHQGGKNDLKPNINRKSKKINNEIKIGNFTKNLYL